MMTMEMQLDSYVSQYYHGLSYANKHSKHQAKDED